MPLYGSIATVKQMLQPTVASPWTADQEAHLAGIQASVSAAIEADLGRTFGAPVADTTELFFAGSNAVVLFDRTARAVTSVAVGGTLDGRTVTGGTPLASTGWTPYPYDGGRGLIYGLRLLGGAGWGSDDPRGRPATPVVVVGDFSDADADAVVPEDLTDVANFLIAETFKYRGASPAGFVGPDGTVVPIRNPWNDPLVKRTLDAYRVGTAAAFGGF